MSQGKKFLMINLVRIMSKWIFCIAWIIFQPLWQFWSGYGANHCGWVLPKTTFHILQWSNIPIVDDEGKIGIVKKLLFRKRSKVLDILIALCQGLKNWCPRSLFEMWVSHCVAHKIVVNTFLMRRWHCWDKSFGV